MGKRKKPWNPKAESGFLLEKQKPFSLDCSEVAKQCVSPAVSAPVSVSGFLPVLPVLSVGKRMLVEATRQAICK